MLIGYARVSTTDQSLNLQKDNLEKAGCEKIYHDVASGVADKRSGLEKLMRIKWHIWRGNVDNAVLRFEQLIARLPEKRKSKVIKLRNYIYNNRDKIVNYRERNKSGQVFTSNIAESNVESLINQRCKGKQHMQ